MAEETLKLVAKRKYLVNPETYMKAPRSSINYSADVGSFPDYFYSTKFQGNYFSAASNDKVRIALGKNWDYRARPTDDPSEKVFSNKWSRPRVFYDSPIELEFCDGTFKEIEGAGSFGLVGASIEENIILKTNVNIVGGSNNILRNWIYYMKTGLKTLDSEYTPIVSHKKHFFDHYHEAINPFTPLELESKSPLGKAFFVDYKSYYNERINSRSFESITNQDPLLQNSLPSIYGFIKFLLNGKLQQKDFVELSPIVDMIKSYHDTNSSNVIKFIYSDLLNRYPLETLTLLYGMIGKDHDQEVENNLNLQYDNTKVVEKILSLSFDSVDGDSLFSDYYNEYIDLISKAPKLKTVTQQDSTKIEFLNNRVLALERAMTNLIFSPNALKFLNKVDQYKKYFPFYFELEFTANLSTDIGDTMRDTFYTKPVSEAVLSRTKPRESQEQEYGRTAAEPGDHSSRAGTWLSTLQSEIEKNFVEYYEEKEFEGANPTNINVEAINEGVAKRYIDFPKFVQDYIDPRPSLGPPFIAPGPDGQLIRGIYFTEQKTTLEHDSHLYDFTLDLRNYSTFFKDEQSEQTGIDDDCNKLFKNLFGSAFYAKLLQTYKDKRRTYNDILNGVPAYTEDLFYRIQKTRIDDDSEEVVQNVLIPNTSELNIVKFVDTQLKYSSDEYKNVRYKYDVYAHRIVFGSRYRYRWFANFGDGDLIHTEDYEKADLTEGMLDLEDPIYSYGISKQDIFHSPGSGTDEVVVGGVDALENDAFPIAGDGGDVSAMDDLNEEYVKGHNLFATMKVDISPSIILVEDKIFSTPDVVIIDKPPVVPDINIIPYRAVNNRVKILLTGASDRYKQVPIVILEGDQQEFDKIKKAQFVVDSLGNPLPGAKIEFANDDVSAVKNFQIFRTTERPKSYSDFELYEQITQQSYEEQILPNKKYYYTFRAIDDHGHISNPTAVYEVELIDEKGAVKPIIRTVDMQQTKNKTIVKDCQKYIYLKPSLKQLYFSDQTDVDSIFSNDNDAKIKKYKMRLTSKGSGKKIDINFSFKKKM